MFDDGKFDAYATPASPPAPLDIALSFPGPGVIRVESASLFADADNAQCLRFLRRAFALEQIGGATLNRAAAPAAELRYDARRHRLSDVLARLADCLTAP
ncbi:MAG: hypothetical protein ACKN9T_06990, partial [Candidatus Methylumidiphilus sp.]